MRPLGDGNQKGGAKGNVSSRLIGVPIQRAPAGFFAAWREQPSKIILSMG